MLRSRRSARASRRWRGVGGSALTGIGGNVGVLVVAHWRWGVVGTVAAARQRGFCRVMSSGRRRWRVGRAVALSRRWRTRAGVGGERPDNQLEGRKEGGGGRATLSMTSSTSRGLWRYEGTWRCIERCCWGVGGRATDDALAGSGIRGDAVVRRAVLSGERRPCETRWRR